MALGFSIATAKKEILIINEAFAVEMKSFKLNARIMEIQQLGEEIGIMYSSLFEK